MTDNVIDRSSMFAFKQAESEVRHAIADVQHKINVLKRTTEYKRQLIAARIEDIQNGTADDDSWRMPCDGEVSFGEGA